jgi:hypothetical protein
MTLASESESEIWRVDDEGRRRRRRLRVGFNDVVCRSEVRKPTASGECYGGCDVWFRQRSQ